MNELLEQFKHLLYVNHPKNVFLAVDYVCSNSPAQTYIHFYHSPIQEFKAQLYRLKYLISTKTLVNSVKVLRENVSFFSPSGQRETFLFNSVNGYSLQQRVENREASRSSGGKQKNPVCNTSSLKSLLTLAHQSEINLVLFTNPVHARYLTLDTELSLPGFGLLSNKKRTVEINLLVAEELNKQPFPFIDFMLINELTTESLDFTAAHEPIYWWESSHYKTILGDQVMNWLSNYPQHQQSNIGFPITASNVTQHLQQQTIQLEASNKAALHE
ncbi:hypothetical protein [Aliiglaciecola litoralis]